MPVIKKCKPCNVYMKRGPLMAERNGRTIVLTKFKVFTCPVCHDEEVVEVKKAKKK